jgi:hypothetical protein
MRLSTLLSKHLTNAANIQELNSVNYFNLCATIWKVRIFEDVIKINDIFIATRLIVCKYSGAGRC